MISPQLPLDDLTARVWQELARSPHDRHHDWRTPVLATQGLDGWPQARTVVLRQTDEAHWTLAVFTDARSPKCAELQAQPAAQLVFWSPRLGWQLRLAVQATVWVEGKAVHEAWIRVSSSPSAKDYLSTRPPGSFCSPSIDPVEPTSADPKNHHLAVLEFEVISMDWLELHRNGHRRASMSRDGTIRRLVP